jgi:hypothetical protein
MSEMQKDVNSGHRGFYVHPLMCINEDSCFYICKGCLNLVVEEDGKRKEMKKKTKPLAK